MPHADDQNPGKIFSFGELLLRFCPDAGGDWLNQQRFPFFVGGAELNVTNALALWGLPVKYFTVLPDNELSQQLKGYLDQKGIDTSAIHLGGDRIGLYFLTAGRDVKHDSLVYDRAGSAFSTLRTGVIDWDKALAGASWFHFSAICPALSQNVADVCNEALEAAEKKGITISVDLNYRSKLWKYGKQPDEIMPGLVKHCNVIMGNIWAAENMLQIGISADNLAPVSKPGYLQQSLETSRTISARFPRCRAVANTFRFDAVNPIKYYTTLYTGNQLYHSREYETDKIADKVGSGDCFMAGLIYGFYKNLAPQEILDFATAAAFEKLFVIGDAIDKTPEQIKARA